MILRRLSPSKLKTGAGDIEFSFGLNSTPLNRKFIEIIMVDSLCNLIYLLTSVNDIVVSNNFT